MVFFLKGKDITMYSVTVLGSMNGSPQQIPSAVGASMQHPAYLAGPGVAMLPYNRKYWQSLYSF